MAAQRIVARSERFTPEGYSEFDYQSEFRHEYVDGEIIAMAEESPRHNRIVRDITVLLQIQFRGRPCESFIEGVRVRVSATKFRYPDVIVLCGEAEMENTRLPTLLNPGALFEVLSDSTQSIDLVQKLNEVRRMPSVSDYVIVAQDRMRVLHYARQENGEWTEQKYTQPQDTLILPAFGVSSSLADIYQSIVFSEAETAAEPQDAP